MIGTGESLMTKEVILQDVPDSPSIRLTVNSAAHRYLESLKDDEAVYFLWGVDGVDSSSRWIAFAYPEHQYRVVTRNPLVTEVCGVKVVVPAGERAADLHGRSLTCERGRLVVT